MCIRDRVVRLTPLLAGVKRCAALLRDADSGDFVVARTYLGHAPQSEGFEALRLAPGDLPLLDQVIATRKLHRVDDVSRSDLVPLAWQSTMGSKTLVVAPLVVQDNVRGVLLVDDADMPYMMSRRQEDLSLIHI